MRQRLAMGLCLGLLSLGASGLQGCGFVDAIAQRQAITRTEFNFDSVQFIGGVVSRHSLIAHRPARRPSPRP